MLTSAGSLTGTCIGSKIYITHVHHVGMYIAVPSYNVFHRLTILKEVVDFFPSYFIFFNQFTSYQKFQNLLSHSTFMLLYSTNFQKDA